MARVVLSGLEPRIAGQIEELIVADGHEVRRAKKNAPIGLLMDADVIFAGGESNHYLPALRRIRAIHASISFIVIARIPRIDDWLEALDAGATDYWPTPVDMTQVRSVMTERARMRAERAGA